MHDAITTGDAARTLDRPIHQVRRTVDQIFPDAPRAGRSRLIDRSQLCELAAAIERRFGNRQAVGR
jgi:hypothetical protein